VSFSHAFGILSMLANPYRVSLFSKCARPLKPPTGTGRSEDVIAMSAAAAVRITQSPPPSRHAAYATIRAGSSRSGNLGPQKASYAVGDDFGVSGKTYEISRSPAY